MRPAGTEHLTMNGIADTVKTPSTAKVSKVRERKKARADTDSDDMLFMQEAAELMFQDMDQQEAADVRRKTR
jgi:hypothetical protein